VAERYFWAMKPKVWIPVLLLGGLLVWAVVRALSSADAGKSDPGASSGTADALPLVTVVEPLRKPAILSLTLPLSVEALNEATLYSKVAGYLQWINVDKGDRVKKGQVLALVEVPEIEKEYQSAQAAVEEAQAVERRAQADESLKEVTYTRLADALDTQTRTMKTEADLPNPDRHILSGMYGTAKLELSAESGALFVPDQAVHRDAEGHPFVYTVAQNRVQKVAIETGLDDGKLIQLRGLRGDERIVLATTANLQEGLSVKAVKNEP